jgi:hypothetical protein
VAVHEFVQLLAGWVPDVRLAAVRQVLADGQPAAAAAAAAAMVTEHDVPLLAESIAAAESIAGKPGVLEGVRPVARYPRFRSGSARLARMSAWMPTTWTRSWPRPRRSGSR